MFDMNFSSLTGDVKDLKEATAHFGESVGANIENAAKYTGSCVYSQGSLELRVSSIFDAAARCRDSFSQDVYLRILQKRRNRCMLYRRCVGRRQGVCDLEE